MASVFFKESRAPGKDWERLTMAKSEAGAQDAVDVARACNSDAEYRVARYARVDSQRWFLQFENTPATADRPASWRNYERDGYPTKEAALADLPESRSVFRVPHRIVCESFAHDVVETFASKGGV